MFVSEIKLYELLKGKLGEKEAEAFVGILETRVCNKFEEKKNEFATKQDMHDLHVKIKEDIAHTRTDLMKSIYFTSLGQLIAIIASVVSLIIVLKS